MSKYAILALLVALAIAIMRIQTLEKRIVDLKLEYTSEAYRAQMKHTKQLQDQADAYGKALSESNKQKVLLAERNQTLHKQLKEVADYAHTLAESIRIYLNSMFEYPTGPDGWPALPANPQERTGTDPAADKAATERQH